jgi:hypothetical protein
MSNETNDDSRNLDRPGTRTVRNAQFPRDMTNVNAGIHAKLGTLPPDGLTLQPKR